MGLTVDPVMTTTFLSAGALEPILVEDRIGYVIMWLTSNEVCITNHNTLIKKI